MIYLLVKEKDNTFKIYSPDTYGMETWGGSSQESIIKKKKYWYINYWSGGNDWIEDTNEDYKLNVILETPVLDDIIRYATLYNESEVEHLLVDAKKIFNDYIDFMLWRVRSRD